jgi:hypothetical protein
MNEYKCNDCIKADECENKKSGCDNFERGYTSRTIDLKKLFELDDPYANEMKRQERVNSFMKTRKEIL